MEKDDGKENEIFDNPVACLKISVYRWFGILAIFNYTP